MISPSAPPSGRPSSWRPAEFPVDSRRLRGNTFFGEKSLMLDLPKTIDADVVIEIDRMLNDRSKIAPVPVHQLAEMIRTRVVTRLSARPLAPIAARLAKRCGQDAVAKGLTVKSIEDNVGGLTDFMAEGVELRGREK